MSIDLNNTGLEAEFKFGSETGGVVDEPPFHILALGNWSGDAEKRALSSRSPIEIDRDNFDEVMERLATKAVLDFEDGSTIDLEFKSLDDFHPDQIFRSVAMFDQLRTLRKKLNNSDTFNSAAFEARQLFGLKREDVAPAAVAETEEPADNLLDAILTKPEGGAAAPKRKLSGELGSLISELVRPHIVAVDEQQQSSLVALVDTATSELMRKILHHRRFQALEASWRGLFFLVRRTDTSTELKIWIFDASKDELATDLKDAESLASTQLYKTLVHEAVELEGAEPWSLVIGDYSFAANVEDVAALMRISKLSAAAGAPFVSHMRPDVLGIHSLFEHPDPKDWNAENPSNEAKLWAALRGQPESQFLGMTTPRFIGRLPYGSDWEPLDTFTFEEFDSGGEHDNYLWSNGGFAAAMLLAQSFAEYGWEMNGRLHQDISGLPLYFYKDDGQKTYKPCAEIPMTEIGVNTLVDAGFMPLVSYKDTDRVKLAMFQSITGSALMGRWRR
jgi:type VI secretion system protein ImpC